MIDPVPLDAFHREYYQKKALKIFRGIPTFYHDLLTFKEIDRLLSGQCLKFPQVRVVNYGLKEQPEASSYTIDGSTIDPELYARQYAQGGTLAIAGLHDRIASLGELCWQLSSYLSHPTQTNIYITPPHEQGFRPHYDTHDVFILQVEGSKHWKLYDTPIDLPLRSQPFELGAIKEGAVSDEFILGPGDMLYIPRGLMHDAHTTDEHSLHITLGVLGYTWHDLLLHSVSTHARNSASLRKNLPIGFLYDPEARRDCAAIFQGVVNELAASFAPEQVLDFGTPNFRKDVRPVPRNVLDPRALDRADVSLTTTIRVKKEVFLIMDRKADDIDLHTEGKVITVPAYLERILGFMSTQDGFLVRDLPDDVDDPGKLVLIRRLLDEGILERM
ncbi:MAG: cupin domain-containing protein [Flavobacteriales bacterium]